ncbi:MAG TPA: F0F1 ATP synthase subunit gamma [Chloroflexota bacterium]|nr:F0F1 ATP synthase subunit gamma [Chloroflexota bacterium]
MESIEDIRRRIKNASDLYAIVRTMRALALTSIRQYERAVESLGDYYRTTELGLHVVLTTAVREGYALPPAPRKPLAERGTGIIVFGSDQSMCGQFNEQIASYTAERLAHLGIPPHNLHVIAIGSRVAPLLAEHGLPADELLSLPGSVAAITPIVQELLLESDQWQNPTTQPIIEQIYLFYNRLQSTVAYRPRMQRLLPINLRQLRHLEQQRWPSPVLPTFSMDWQPLFSALLREHLFVSLFRAFAESLASENAARLVSMQAAERNIEERLDELHRLYHHQRQDAITSELMDIISGFELLSQPPS